MKIPFGRIGAAVASCLLLLWAGCTPSLHPFFTEKDVVFEPALIGAFWEDEGKPTWTFSQGENRAYTLEIRDGEKSSTFVAHLFKLGEHRYLDLYPAEGAIEDCPREDFLKSALVPGHLIFRVPGIGAKLELQALEESWLKESLRGKISVPHALIEHGRLVLTGSTPQLQEFLRQVEREAGAWGEPGEFRRKS